MAAPRNHDSFSYTVGNTLRCIVDTEKQLRDVIDDMLVRHYGVEWATYPKVGFKEAIQLEIKNRIEQDRKRADKSQSSIRYIDYTYLDDLVSLIEKHWNLFKTIFRSKKRTQLMLEELVRRRDFIAHGRDNFEQWEYHLILGSCGHLQSQMREWNSGFSHSTRSYLCHLNFNERSDELRPNPMYPISAEFWLERVLRTEGILNNGTAMEPDGKKETYLLRFRGGHARIQVNSAIEGKDTSASVTLESHNPNLISKIIRRGNHPYNPLSITLTTPLNLLKVRDYARMARHKVIELSNEDGRLKTIQFNMVEFQSGEKVVTKIINEGTVSRIEILYDGSKHPGFFRAHQLFSLKTILGILYYDIKPAKAHQLVLESMTHGNHELSK